MFWLWALACSALAQAPHSDAFSKEDVEVATKQQEMAAIALVQNAVQLNDVADSIRYHLSKHGNGRTLQKYTEDAIEFFERNKARAEWGRWNPNWEPSYRLKVGNQGGYYTADGSVLSCWD